MEVSNSQKKKQQKQRRISSTSHRDRIVERLIQHGIPPEQLHQMQPGLVGFVEENRSMLPGVVSAILTSCEDVSEEQMNDLFAESLIWLQWLMFGDSPQLSLTNLAEKALGQRAVCGAVWGNKDLAYRCRTCEHDPTCAICVPCFQNGDHKDHDYSIMFAGTGCCDCGDATAWKPEGFCSKHKGAEGMQPLPQDVADSMGPVIDNLLLYWKEKLLAVEGITQKHPDEENHTYVHGKVANELSSAIVEMFLDFCNCSESLLFFISKRISDSVGLLDLLVSAEMFLDKSVVKKLHGLLLKFLGEPFFKYNFAKVFTEYYPRTSREILRKSSDSTNSSHLIMSTFSVQIFTVPNLALLLVREMNLLGLLLDCLEDLFHSCAGEDGYLQPNKWSRVCRTMIRIVEDIRYIMSHDEVQKYIAHECLDISRKWFRLLTLVQGIAPQKRVTGLHIEVEDENFKIPFILEHNLGNIQILLVDAAFSVCGVKEKKYGPHSSLRMDALDLQHANSVGLLQESSACCSSSRNNDNLLVSSIESINTHSHTRCHSIPSAAASLFFECLKSVGNWLSSDTSGRTNMSAVDTKDTCNMQKLHKGLLHTRNHIHTAVYRKSQSPPVECIDVNTELNGSKKPAHGTHSEQACVIEASHGDPMDVDSVAELEELGILSLAGWPEIVYDVSSQEISFHIPLHRFLSLLLRQAMKTSYGDIGLKTGSGICGAPLSGKDFFRHVLGGCHPYGFSAFMMEHPLRLRVFCAQAHAGMWRKNGDTGLYMSDLYSGVHLSDKGLELDLFLLQCCAALAPPESFVLRILERFGLSNYLSLNLEEYNEYEPVLVQEMLTLIIQIVKERRYCGLSTTENLQRELIYTLAARDSTHSQLVNALPHDLSENKQLQEVVYKVALYVKPSSLEQGKYSLRGAYWKELDLYHPRWNSRDKQVAEERYLRSCKVSPADVQLPRWTEVFSPLNTVFRIATSKAVLQIVQAVIFYATFTETSTISRAPDGVLVTALHLLSLALDICEKKKDACIDKIGIDADMSHASGRSCEGVSCPAEYSFPVLMFSTKAFGAENETWKNQSILSLLVSLMRKRKKENDLDNEDSRLCNISSLIKGLLEKFALLNTDCMNELTQLAPEIIFKHPPCSYNSGAQRTKVCSDLEERKAKAREHQAAILKKMKAEQSKFIASIKSTENADLDSANSIQGEVHEELAPVCSLCHDTDSKSPLSYLVLLQKSRLSSFVDRGPLSWEEASQSVIEKGQKDMVGGVPSSTTVVSPTHLRFTDNPQPKEVDALLDASVAQLSATRKTQVDLLSNSVEANSLQSLEMMENDIYKSIQEDIHSAKSHSGIHANDQTFASSCDSEGSTNSKNSVSSLGEGYVASLLSKASKQSLPLVECPSHTANGSPMATSQCILSDQFGPFDCDGIHISSCGHAVHQECHDRYLSSLKQRYLRRLGFEGGHIVDPAMGELLCPVCRRFANSILPVFSGGSSKVPEQTTSSYGSLTSNINNSTLSDSDVNALRLSHALSLLRSTSKIIKHGSFLKVFSRKTNENMESALEPIIQKLCMMYSPRKHGSLRNTDKPSHSLMLWDTLRYSLVSNEIASRGRDGPYSKGYDSLYGELHSNRFIISVLIPVAQATQTSNCLQLLLRFGAVQLFTSSICAGVLGNNNNISDADRNGGPLSSIMEHVVKEGGFSGIQFWKLAADPILARDPFSSLMWLLFSLPLPFLSSKESFIPLVHLFYVVCVIQALITYHSKYHFDSPSFAGSLLSDICSAMGQSDIACQYFVSKYIDDSCNLEDMVRKFSSPYLRRCELLWKLLQPSPSDPCYDNPCVFDNTSSLPAELRGVSELEKMFQICPLEAIFNDKIVHDLALKWCEHFCQVFGDKKTRQVLYCTPAVPFKLMQLPLLYQDLLQRYIKKQCPGCKSVPNEPALCLLCGEICSPSWRTCCRESRCQSHAIACASGVGIFLLVKKTTILLQRSARQARWPSLYLDAFGEEDRDMSRGKPLYLSEERYAALTNLVASHGLDHSSEVLRQTTISLYSFD